MNVLELGQHSFALLRDGLGGDTDALGMFCDLFTADGELWLPPTPNTQSPYRGPEAIRKLLCDFVPALYQDGLQLRLYQLLTGPDRVLFQFEDRGRKQDGSDYQNSPCIALAFRDQQISGFWEYWGGPGFFRDQLDGSGARGNVDADAQDTARRAMSQLITGMGGSVSAMDGFLAMMSDDVRLWFPPTANTRSPYIGRADARRLFRDFLMTMYPDGMAIEIFHETSGGTRTAFELQSRGVRRDGSVYVNSPCLCLDIKGGRIEWACPDFTDTEVSRMMISEVSDGKAIFHARVQARGGESGARTGDGDQSGGEGFGVERQRAASLGQRVEAAWESVVSRARQAASG